MACARRTPALKRRYSRLSLRDSEVGCRIATTIMAEKTRRTLKPHFYFVIISESFVLVPSDMIALGEACGEGPLLTQPGKPCPCLGTVTEYLHLKADQVEPILVVLLIYLLAGSFWFSFLARKPAELAGSPVESGTSANALS